MIDLGKYNILGVKVDAVDYEGAVAKIIYAAQAKKSMTVAAQPVHGIMTAVLDEHYRSYLNHFDLVCPDGQPVRWALNLLYRTQLRDRVCGPILMLKLCEKAAQEQLSIFFYGSTPKVLEKLEKNLKHQFPTLQIAGMISPAFRPLSDEETDAYLEQIRQSGAAITFVGLGCPRQEKWAFEHRYQVNTPLLCVGAAFDFHAGGIPRAPHWMQQAGLEWLFRLIQEPKRLWSRYLLLNPLYILFIMLQLLKLFPVEQLTECRGKKGKTEEGKEGVRG